MLLACIRLSKNDFSSLASKLVQLNYEEGVSEEALLTSLRSGEVPAHLLNTRVVKESLVVLLPSLRLDFKSKIFVSMK